MYVILKDDKNIAYRRSFEHQPKIELRICALTVVLVVVFPDVVPVLLGRPWTLGLIAKVGGGLSPVDKLFVARAAGVVGKESALKDPLRTWVISIAVK